MRLVNKVVVASVMLLLLTVGVRADLMVYNYAPGSAAQDTVTRYDSETGSSKGTFATVHTTGGMVSGMTFGLDGNLYASIHNWDKVERFNGVTGVYVSDFVPEDSAHIDGAAGLEFRSDGYLYVVSNHSSSVARYDATTGAFHDVFIPSGLGGVKSPTNIAWRDSYVYLNSSVTNQILRYKADGTFDSIFVSAGLGGLNAPLDLAFGPNGDYLYVCSALSDEVLRYNSSDGSFKDVFIPSGAGLDRPQSLEFRDGVFYVVGGDSHNVLRINVDGTDRRILVNSDSQASALVLTPVPAPGAIVLGGIGLSFAGWLCRGRTKSQRQAHAAVRGAR